MSLAYASDLSEDTARLAYQLLAFFEHQKVEVRPDFLHLVKAVAETYTRTNIAPTPSIPTTARLTRSKSVSNDLESAATNPFPREWIIDKSKYKRAVQTFRNLTGYGAEVTQGKGKTTSTAPGTAVEFGQSSSAAITPSTIDEMVLPATNNPLNLGDNAADIPSEQQEYIDRAIDRVVERAIARTMDRTVDRAIERFAAASQ